MTTTKPTIDAPELAIKLAALLLREHRLRHETVFPRNPDASIVIRLSTITRDYGRLKGGGGATIRNLTTIIHSIEPGIELELTEADETAPKLFQTPPSLVRVVEEVVAASRSFVAPMVEPHPHGDGIIITTDDEVDEVMRVACENIFFSIGRAQNERGAIHWVVR